MLTTTSIRTCRGLRARSTAGVAASLAALLVVAPHFAQAASLRLRGNEPGWHIEMSDKAMTFQMLDGEAFTIEPPPQATTADGVDTYSATVDGRRFTLTVAATPCADTMTGMPYPKTATVVVGDRKLTGCGGEPASLLHGDWQVEEIGGKAIVAGSKPSVAFEPDGRIHGNGSCNRFFGGFQLTGEGLKISDTGASMMMCEKPLMDQERALLKALTSAHRFEITPEGRLRLLGQDDRAVASLRK